MLLFNFYGSLVINQVYGRIDNLESQLCIWKDSINCFVPLSNLNKFIKKKPKHKSQVIVIDSALFDRDFHKVSLFLKAI